MITDVADDIVEICTQAVEESNASKRAKADAASQKKKDAASAKQVPKTKK